MYLDPTEMHVSGLPSSSLEALYSLSMLSNKPDLEPNDKEKIDHATVQLVYTLFRKTPYAEKANAVSKTWNMLLGMIVKYVAEPIIAANPITFTVPSDS